MGDCPPYLTIGRPIIITPNGSVSVSFDSKENTSTSHPAVLSVVLSGSGAGGAAGPTGPTGAKGATGATGAGVAGATGATRATSSSSIYFMSSVGTGGSGDAMNLMTGPVANITGTVGPLTMSGHMSAPTSIQLNGGPVFVNNGPYSGMMQVFPMPVTFTQMYGTLSFQQTLILVGWTLNIQAQLYRYQNSGGSGVLSAVSGATCTFFANARAAPSPA
jgi:hypothetical protein